MSIDEINKILQQHEQRLSKLEKIFESKPAHIPLTGENKISHLINSGFFDTNKKFGEVIRELKTQAKFDNADDYKAILVKFTREDKLERKIVDHQWVYRKK